MGREQGGEAWRGEKGGDGEERRVGDMETNLWLLKEREGGDGNLEETYTLGHIK